MQRQLPPWLALIVFFVQTLQSCAGLSHTDTTPNTQCAQAQEVRPWDSLTLLASAGLFLSPHQAPGSQARAITALPWLWVTAQATLPEESAADARCVQPTL